MSYTPEEVADEPRAAYDDWRGKGPALVVRSGGGRAGESFFPSGERTLIGRSPECDVFLDDVTVSRRHAELVARRRDVHDQRPGQPQRHVREPEADRVGRARGRRRAPDRQVPPDLPAPMSTTTTEPRRAAPSSSGCTRSAPSARGCSPSSRTSRSRRSATSRIRACSTPKRTRGGYRLFSEEDVERLETILRLQRDEFLPLRVIRQELAAAPGAERKRRRPAGLGEHEGEIDLAELCERAGHRRRRSPGRSRSTAC